MPTSVFLTYSLPANAALSVASVTATGAIAADTLVATTSTTTAALSASGDFAATTVTMANGGAIRTGTSLNNTALLQAYDVDGAGYKTFATLTAANTPTLATLPPSGGTIAVAGTTYAVGATAGADGTGAVITGITVAKGLVTSITVS